MGRPYLWNRVEAAGSLGDLGTLLPMAMGMILVNGLAPTGLFFSVGAFYILAGLYYGVPVSVQPMKVIGAYAIARGISAPEILASGAWMALFLLVIGITGVITPLAKAIPKPVIRGVQLSTGTLLMAGGVKFMVGTSRFQELQHAAEPFLTIQALGPVPMGLALGVAGGLLTLLFLENRRFPAGLLVVLFGVFAGIILGTGEGFAQLKPGLYVPSWLPFGIPARADFLVVLFTLSLPQLPMTLGNAVVANADLSREYFGHDSRRVTERALCISMGLANAGAFLVGGMPLCHGAGGLAAHYRFGARSGASNLMIGGLFLALALFLGPHALAVLHLIPMAVLGVLLLFAGSQLALTIRDLSSRKDFFVALVILGITLASNLAAGFLAGIAVAYILRSERFSI